MASNTIYDKDLNSADFLSVLQKYKSKVSKTEESSKTFLVELGVITDKGNLKTPYKNLCIPTEQE